MVRDGRLRLIDGSCRRITEVKDNSAFIDGSCAQRKEIVDTRGLGGITEAALSLTELNALENVPGSDKLRIHLKRNLPSQHLVMLQGLASGKVCSTMS